MSILKYARHVVEWMKAFAHPSAWHWKTCLHCGSTVTVRNGSYTRHPHTVGGPAVVRIQRHLCRDCGRTYAEQPPQLVPHSWYGRGVHRMGIDLWCHGRMSLRRVAEWVRSCVGHQERWWAWHPWQEPQGTATCRLHASTLHRWLDRAGQQAEASAHDQWAGVASSGLMGADGVWTRLRGDMERVVLVLVDRVSGLLWPPVVAEGEQAQAPWDRLFDRAREAGLNVWRVRGVVSDGAQGLQTHLHWRRPRVRHQRCVFHLWRTLKGRLQKALAAYLPGGADEASQAMRAVLWKGIKRSIRSFLDEPYEAASKGEDPEAVAEAVLEELRASPLGRVVAEELERYREPALAACQPGLARLGRVGPEWIWRDWRQRLSRGHNHGREQRLRRAAWVWTIYHNFTPRQARRERKRAYPHAGESPLEVAGVDTSGISYLDALGV